MSEREEYRLLRLRKRIRLDEIALLLGCHKSHLSNYENGRANLNEEKVKKYRSYITEKERELK